MSCLSDIIAKSYENILTYKWKWNDSGEFTGEIKEIIYKNLGIEVNNFNTSDFCDSIPELADISPVVAINDCIIPCSVFEFNYYILKRAIKYTGSYETDPHRVEIDALLKAFSENTKEIFESTLSYLLNGDYKNSMFLCRKK